LDDWDVDQIESGDSTTDGSAEQRLRAGEDCFGVVLLMLGKGERPGHKSRNAQDSLGVS
jgi:hypothetical protein